MPAALDHMWSNLSAAFQQNTFFDYLDCFLDVFQVSTAHKLCHFTDQHGCLDFLLESISIEDDVFDSINFEIKF
jgi:hypothetical protein